MPEPALTLVVPISSIMTCKFVSNIEASAVREMCTSMLSRQIKFKYSYRCQLVVIGLYIAGTTEVQNISTRSYQTRPKCGPCMVPCKYIRQLVSRSGHLGSEARLSTLGGIIVRRSGHSASFLGSSALFIRNGKFSPTSRGLVLRHVSKQRYRCAASSPAPFFSFG